MPGWQCADEQSRVSDRHGRHGAACEKVKYPTLPLDQGIPPSAAVPTHQAGSQRPAGLAGGRSLPGRTCQTFDLIHPELRCRQRSAYPRCVRVFALYRREDLDFVFVNVTLELITGDAT
jgi:hypothetical protein